ncbi:hypothetical protein G6F32_016494 [Rhizopus arrhizus]|nr:hypothetical protein G6F32_016494 [Rhizopus arrhizus]
MHRMAPVSAGTDNVVWVRNSIQTTPARPAGNAVMITNGSVQDWKLMTISRPRATHRSGRAGQPRCRAAAGLPCHR